MFVVCVNLKVKSGMIDEFLPLIKENARQSLEQEPGCHQFDVCHAASNCDDQEIFLYELYTDRAAFDTHLSSAHFLDFDQKTANMVESKFVRFFQKIA